MDDATRAKLIDRARKQRSQIDRAPGGAIGEAKTEQQRSQRQSTSLLRELRQLGCHPEDGFDFYNSDT